MKRKIIALKLFVCNGLLFVLTLLYAVAFRLSGELGKNVFACKFLERTGIYCPACGGSRALIHLLNFNIKESFLFYPPLLISLVLITIVDLFVLFYIVNGNERYLKVARAEVFIIIPFTVLLFFFIRSVLLLFGIDYIGEVLPG